MKDELFDSLLKSVQQADDILSGKKQASRVTEIFSLPRSASERSCPDHHIKHSVIRRI